MSGLDCFVLAMFALGIAGAFFTAFHPNILYAAISLIATLGAVAGIYAALGADFLAATQLIIYVGGILIVILFAVMMSESIYKKRFAGEAKKYLIPSGVSILFLTLLFKLLFSADWGEIAELSQSQDGVTLQMGQALARPYALPFQYVAIVLLFGLIGAVVIARPHIGKKRG
jgi:NADH:ubiquinone oxidoreductase subunit 6 (subunit J)